MNKHLAESDLATPKVTTGPITGSRKIYATPEAAPDLKVPLREVVLDPSSGEPPVLVYDPSGPYSDPDARIDVEKGLPRLRSAWVRERLRLLARKELEKVGQPVAFLNPSAKKDA